MGANGYGHDDFGPPEFVDRSPSPGQVKQRTQEAIMVAMDMMLPGDTLLVAREEQCCARHPQWTVTHTRPSEANEPPDGVEPYSP